ncbi:MAG: LysR family transcriptional regulator [Oscillospiraceae bacterium]|nr:LysR family transcriptional regulator [Oscillospiraceae bacterium]
MEILQLRYFYESAKSQNFTVTAKKYLVPVSAVSSSIKRLEKELGCQLFDRDANRIRLNSNGRLLQQSLCAVFHELDDTIAKLSTHNQDSREIKLLVRGMRRNITNFITEYKTTYPDTSFKIVFEQEGVDFLDYDVIIDEENERYSEYERIELFTMQLRLKCSVEHSLCNKTLYLNQLCKQPFILMDTNGNMNRILLEACNRAGFQPQISVVCNDIECYEKFLKCNMGIGIGRQSEPSAETISGVVDLDVCDFKERYTLYAYYVEKEYYGNVKNFVEFIKRKVLNGS